MTNPFLGPVVVDIAGLCLTSEDEALLANPWVGGVILFKRNYQNRYQLAELVSAIRRINFSLLIAVDHEGGRVQRFRSDFTRIPPMQALGREFRHSPEIGLRRAQDIGWLLASELIAAGLDISFTPVIDVDDHVSDVIGDRSFAADADTVSLIGSAFIRGVHEAGMAVTGKHFPGHGGVKADSHLELPVDPRSLSELESCDLKPFIQLLPELDALMPAHILFPNVDSKPVGFSSWWLKTYLRDKLGYRGVVFSDDLSMAGAVGIGSYGERAMAAFDAGCSAILVCNDRAGALEVLDVVERRYSKVFASQLESMRARKAVAWSSLEASPRWRNTQESCGKMLAVT